jgi:hypothetical protein
MNIEYRRRRTLELIDLVLMHDPNAPIGLLTDVISDWGDLFDGEQVSKDPTCHPSTSAESPGPRSDPQSALDQARSLPLPQ